MGKDEAKSSCSSCSTRSNELEKDNISARRVVRVNQPEDIHLERSACLLSGSTQRRRSREEIMRAVLLCVVLGDEASIVKTWKADYGRSDTD